MEMVTNLVNDSYVFSSDMQDIRIADVHDKLSLRIEVDGQEALSEIYYPDGWHVTIDGQPAELARADYILRTMYVPAGQHTIEMRFDPTSLHVTEGIAYGALALLVIGIIVAVLIAKRKYVKA